MWEGNCSLFIVLSPPAVAGDTTSTTTSPTILRFELLETSLSDLCLVSKLNAMPVICLYLALPELSRRLPFGLLALGSCTVGDLRKK
jgi:hypothetical protein